MLGPMQHHKAGICRPHKVKKTTCPRTRFLAKGSGRHHDFTEHADGSELACGSMAGLRSRQWTLISEKRQKTRSDPMTFNRSLGFLCQGLLLSRQGGYRGSLKKLASSV